MLAHPILINRPIVVTERGVRLCRPSEVVLEILAKPDIGPFTKENGEVVAAKAGPADEVVLMWTNSPSLARRRRIASRAPLREGRAG